MTWEFVTFVALGAAFGGFINGLAGTGTALFSLGFYLIVLDPPQAVAIVALMAILVGTQGMWIVRKDILGRPDRTLRFVIPGLIGVPLGLGLLKLFDPTTLRIGVACTLIFYGFYFGFRARLPAFDKRTPVVDVVIGFCGGVLGGMAALSGALVQIWLSLRPWTKGETRAVLQPFNFAVLGATVVSLFVLGAFDQSAFKALLLTLPIGLVFAQVGVFVFRRLSDTGFRRLLIMLTLFMGLGVLFSELV